eukprot:scaffold1763_cov211-Pinguiococcus_pyrenoidosus.AAC.3
MEGGTPGGVMQKLVTSSSFSKVTRLVTFVSQRRRFKWTTRTLGQRSRARRFQASEVSVACVAHASQRNPLPASTRSRSFAQYASKHWRSDTVGEAAAMFNAVWDVSAGGSYDARSPAINLLPPPAPLSPSASFSPAVASPFNVPSSTGGSTAGAVDCGAEASMCSFSTAFYKPWRRYGILIFGVGRGRLVPQRQVRVHDGVGRLDGLPWAATASTSQGARDLQAHGQAVLYCEGASLATQASHGGADVSPEDLRHERSLLRDRASLRPPRCLEAGRTARASLAAGPGESAGGPASPAPAAQRD